MVLNTFTVATSATPTFFSTFFSHFCSCSSPPQDEEPFELGYYEGIALIRRFLTHASHHTVEELQAFTARPVPQLGNVCTETVVIQESFLDASADIIRTVDNGTWWQWRERELKAEWIWVPKRKKGGDIQKEGTRKEGNQEEGIQMDEVQKKETQSKEAQKEEEGKNKILFYIHGGAYYFGSVDEHLYQIQRHARKLGARVLAPRYRLAPQFPFPCGLYDALACYLYLLDQYPPESIIFAGDSAGAGMLLSLLCILRDRNLVLPAAAVLISPWVDLCHSFPSVVGDASRDYIPPHGFLHRTSPAWPPPPSPRNRRTVQLDETNTVEITEQIQMYAPNDMLSHPLVSPVNQPSLGGLPPMLILSGGGELLRDEQIYLAHKAAFPATFSPNTLSTYPPTKVHLQVFANACHALPTLSWTQPAKAMSASITTFAGKIWAGKGIEGFKYENVSTTSGVTEVQPLTPGDFPPPEQIGTFTAEPLKRWMAARQAWTERFPAKRGRVEKIEEEEEGVPPSAAYRRRKEKGVEGGEMQASEGRNVGGSSWIVDLWEEWGRKSPHPPKVT